MKAGGAYLRARGKRALLVFAAVGIGAFGVLRPALAEAPPRRFAVLAGNDNGGPDTRPLMYAREDARRLHEVLVRVGGVDRADALLLLNDSVDAFTAALAEIDRRARAAAARGQRTSLLVYYSGHAKDGELRFGSTRLGLAALRARIARCAVDVRVTIIDSCRSGAVTRHKGARVAPAFVIETTGAEDAQGSVFLTSSSFDEDAQESDLINGSYFSHHLINGLRGDADQSRDGKVTLAEAYDYAYAHTVADTADSLAGAQHPTFSYELKGNGDLVLSDYGASNEGLYVPAPAPAGTYYLVDARGVVAAEVVKERDQDRRISLRAGSYRIKRRLPDRLRVGQIEIPVGGLVTLDEARLRDAAFSDDPVKGGNRDVGLRTRVSGGIIAQTFFDQPTRVGLFPPAGMATLDLSLANFFREQWVVAVDVAWGQARGTFTSVTGAPYSFRFREGGAGAALVKEWALFDGRVVPFVGPRLAFVYMTRTFDDPTLPGQSFSTFSPGLVAGARFSLSDRLSLMARTRTHYLLYNVDENRSLGYVELGVALMYEL